MLFHSSRSKVRCAATRAVMDQLEPRQMLTAVGDALALLPSDYKQQLVDALGPDRAATIHVGDTDAQFNSELRSVVTGELTTKSGYFYQLADLSNLRNTVTGNAGMRTLAGIQPDPQHQGQFIVDTTNSGTHGTNASGILATTQVFPGVASPLPDRSGTEVDWNSPGPTGDDDTWVAMNGFQFWKDLSYTYQFTQDNSYVDEIVRELASWSKVNPDGYSTFPDDAGKPSDYRLFVNGIRAEMWTSTYPLVLNSPSWTDEANTLFLYEMLQTGKQVNTNEPNWINDSAAYVPNQDLQITKGLLYTGSVFYFFDHGTNNANDWRSTAHDRLWQALDNNFYSDGGPEEESATYAFNNVDDVLDMYKLDMKNNKSSYWTDPAHAVGGNIPQKWAILGAQGFDNLLEPTGILPGLSDSHRDFHKETLYKADLVLNGITGYSNLLTSHQRPKVDFIYIFVSNGQSDLQADLDLYPRSTGLPVGNAPMAGRGGVDLLPRTGLSVQRTTLNSTDNSKDLQTILDFGPRGLGAHGHKDILSMEMYAQGTPILVNSGYNFDKTTRQAAKNHNMVLIGPTGSSTRPDPSPLWEEGDQPLAWFQSQSGAANGDWTQMSAYSENYNQVGTDKMVNGRTIWQHKAGVVLIMDWVKSPGLGGNSTVYNELHVNGTTTTSPGTFTGALSYQVPGITGNVTVTPLFRSGQTGSLAANTDYEGEIGTVSHIEVSQAINVNVVFATLITLPGVTATATYGNTDTSAGSPFTVNVTVSGYNSGNPYSATFYQPGGITASVFNDANGNGVKDTSELFLTGRKVYWDANNNNVLDEGEYSGLTDSTGSYKFRGVPPTTDVIIRQILPGGWSQTTPSNGFGVHINVASAGSYSALFGSKAI